MNAVNRKHDGGRYMALASFAFVKGREYLCWIPATQVNP
jgi:hypothetical protein